MPLSFGILKGLWCRFFSARFPDFVCSLRYILELMSSTCVKDWRVCSLGCQNVWGRTNQPLRVREKAYPKSIVSYSFRHQKFRMQCRKYYIIFHTYIGLITTGERSQLGYLDARYRFWFNSSVLVLFSYFNLIFWGHTFLLFHRHIL